MKSWGFRWVVLSILLTILTLQGQVADRLSQKLTLDKQVVHVLNRLTFGARPSDAAEVRRLGVAKWVDLQLHPDRIQENPVLESRLKALESLQLASWQIAEKYPPPQQAMVRPAFVPQAVLNPLQLSKLMNG